MMYDELISDIKVWLEQMDKKHSDVSKDKLYFNVSYNQMNGILEALSNLRDYCKLQNENYRLMENNYTNSIQENIRITKEIQDLIVNLKVSDEKLIDLWKQNLK